MELTQLAQFKAIAESKTMTEAAESIHISQPALSASLRNLENELGVRLFERSRNRIVLNEAGKLALLHAARIVEQAEDMKTELARYARKENSFSVAFCDPGPLWYSVPRFSLAHPECELSYRRFEESADDCGILLSGSADIVFSSHYLTHPDISGFLFITDQLLLSVGAAHPLAGMEEINLRTTESLHLAYFNGMGSFHKKQLPFWEEAGDRVTRTFYDDRELYAQTVRSTDVPTISTRLASHYRNDGAGRVLVPLADPEFSIDYYVCYLTKHKKRLRAFIEWAKGCAGELGARGV
jgi:DNA-binding transcriptional LysR family regulator